MIIRDQLQNEYADIYTAEVLAALEAISAYNQRIHTLMNERMDRRHTRIQRNEHLQFLDPETTIPGTDLPVSDVRAGKFVGSAIPQDLECQWIQGTGPAARPGAPS